MKANSQDWWSLEVLRSWVLSQAPQEAKGLPGQDLTSSFNMVAFHHFSLVEKYGAVSDQSEHISSLCKGKSLEGKGGGKFSLLRDRNSSHNLI